MDSWIILVITVYGNYNNGRHKAIVVGKLLQHYYVTTVSHTRKIKHLQ